MKDIFINRKSKLKQLISGLLHINGYVLIAPRSYGKTAIALKAWEELKQ